MTTSTREPIMSEALTDSEILAKAKECGVPFAPFAIVRLVRSILAAQSEQSAAPVPWARAVNVLEGIDDGATWFIVVDPETNEGHFCYDAALGREFGHDHIKDAMEDSDLVDSAKHWVIRPAFATPPTFDKRLKIPTPRRNK